MSRRPVILPLLMPFLSVLAVGWAFVACQFQAHGFDYGWPCTWLTDQNSWHFLEMAADALTGLVLIASTFATTRLLFKKRRRARCYIRLSSFFVWMTAIALLLSLCDFGDSPPEWLEQLTEFHPFVLMPLFFGLGCVACSAWTLLEQAFLCSHSQDAARA